jgi:hypothetical protein
MGSVFPIYLVSVRPDAPERQFIAGDHPVDPAKEDTQLLSHYDGDEALILPSI